MFRNNHHTESELSQNTQLLSVTENPLWVDKQQRSLIWPLDGVLMAVLTRGNPIEVESDILLLNIFARMLALRPHEVILQPRLVHPLQRQPGHTYCYALPGIMDLVQQYHPLLELTDEESLISSQEKFPGLVEAYCPCGHDKHTTTTTADTPPLTVAIAMSGNLSFLQRSWQAGSNNASQYRTLVSYGFLIGGHEKNLSVFLPDNFPRDNGLPPPLTLTSTTSSVQVMMRGAVRAERWDVVRNWVQTTPDKPEDVVRFLLLAGASPHLLKHATRTLLPSWNPSHDDDETEHRRMVWIRDFFEAYEFGKPRPVVFKPNPREIHDRIFLWDTAMELGLVSRWALGVVAPHIRDMNETLVMAHNEIQLLPLANFFKKMENEEYWGGMSMWS